MQQLSNFTIKTVNRSAHRDPVQQRRAKLLSKLDEQLKVFAAAQRGETYSKTKTVWVTNSDGQRVQTKRTRAVRAWFFEQDDGWYVQCRYGAKPLRFGDDGNAIFVDKLDDVEKALNAMRVAIGKGDMDDLIAEALKGQVSAGVQRKKPRA
ncbi:hypothetical protein [Oceanicaulis sp.]|uniref:hypothetical protein n=1 Tax=Oceanicaulis sp. TaxID=1924941 RepID=UPI003BA85B34